MKTAYKKFCMGGNADQKNLYSWRPMNNNKCKFLFRFKQKLNNGFRNGKEQTSA